MSDQVISIAVLGVTGAGKSTFVHRVTQDPNIVIGHSLKAQTTTTTGYTFNYNGTRYEIVDCPGFNDTFRPDEEILEDIVTWLRNAHGEGKLLSGIVYIHRISDTRVQGTTMTQLRVLQELCGTEFYDNLVLGTTFWSKVSEEEGRGREIDLLGDANFFGEMTGLGAEYARVPDDREGCLQLLEKLSLKQRRQLKAQKELAEGRSIRSTAAFRVLDTRQNVDFQRVLLKLWHYLHLFLLVLGNWMAYSYKEFEAWRELRAQEAARQAEINKRLEQERKPIQEAAADWSTRFGQLQQTMNSVNQQLRRLDRRGNPVERERRRQERILERARKREARDERKRQWEIDHQDWEYRREEALDDFDIQESCALVIPRSGHALTLVSCDQPGCSSSLWMSYYNKCSSCSSRWCGNCNKHDRYLHRPTCRGYKRFGGLTREEALERCFYETEPEFEDDDDLDWGWLEENFIMASVLSFVSELFPWIPFLSQFR